MASETLIEIRLAGEGIAPGTVRSSELAEILTSTEKMIAATIMQNNPLLQLKEDEIVVGLVSIKGGSLGLAFTSPLMEFVRLAIVNISEAVQRGDFSRLPSSAVEEVRKLASFTRRRNCPIELRVLNGREEVLATIHTTTVVEATEPARLVGTTSLYGRLIRVGGREPKAVLDLDDGISISCIISEELARRLAPKLYTWVGVRGTAEWEAESLKLETFKIEEILPYEETPINEAFAELSRRFSQYFDHIDDVDDYVVQLRAE